ncbi:hypothetical protein AKJ16_DCAP20730 [Drosera capensis]
MRLMESTCGVLGMATTEGSANVRNVIHAGKNCLLPPKSPFRTMSPPYADYGPNSLIGSKAISKPKLGSAGHQRTSSESFLLEEQPSWLDELLNEPETPVRRGHRRSSSDSFAYLDAANLSNIEYVPVSQRDNKLNPMVQNSLWGNQNFDYYNDLQQGSYFSDLSSGRRSKNIAWEAPISSVNHLSNLPLRDNSILRNARSSAGQREADQVLEKQDHDDSCLHDPRSSAEKKDSSIANSSSSEYDTRRAKQQFAQRSRVRKLQYIAELERNVEGSEVAAELEFLNQQSLILSMENKALKQRLETMAQEQLIKYLITWLMLKWSKRCWRGRPAGYDLYTNCNSSLRNCHRSNLNTRGNPLGTGGQIVEIWIRNLLICLKLKDETVIAEWHMQYAITFLYPLLSPKLRGLETKAQGQKTETKEVDYLMKLGYCRYKSILSNTKDLTSS